MSEENKKKNRIEKYFDEYDAKLNKKALPINKFPHIEFEKFDPTITQNVVQSSDSENEYQDGYGENIQNVTKKIVISQDSQLLQTLNLWVANCDVKLKNNFIPMIKDIDGVETLDFISRYRFRVGIGKLFDENIVKEKISNLIDAYFKASTKLK